MVGDGEWVFEAIDKNKNGTSRKIMILATCLSGYGAYWRFDTFHME